MARSVEIYGVRPRTFVGAFHFDPIQRGVANSQRVDDQFFDERFEFLRRWMAAVENDTYYAL